MLKIAIADDDIIFRDYLISCVDWAGMETEVVACAKNGYEAIEQANQLRPDIVILDVEMPGQNGLACAKKIRSLLPDCEILMITGHEKFQYAQESVKLGVRDILLKPLDKEEMEQALGRTLKEYWMRHVLDNVLQMIWNNDNNLVVLLRQAAPGNDICDLCSQIIAAVETADGEKIEKSIEAYLTLIKRWDIPAVRLFWLYVLPAAACVALLRNEEAEIPAALCGEQQLLQQIRTAQEKGEIQQALSATCGKAAAVLRPQRCSCTAKKAEAAMALIRQHYSDPEFSMTRLAQLMYIHEGYLRRLFKVFYGEAPNTTLKKVRMLEARRLLNDTDLLVQQVAHQVGFDDESYFSKCFKQYFGYPPAKVKL